jgi:O-antigen/teichoic acid export membrane protein
VYVTGMLAYVVIRLDVLLVNGYLGQAETGYYSLAVALSDMICVFPLVVAVNLFPRAARGASDETSAEILRSTALLFAGVCLLTAVLAQTLIRILYGPEFLPAAELFWWLAPGTFAIGVLNILAHHFAARGYPVRLMVYWLLALILNVGINIVFLPSQGTYIASLSSSITYVVLLALHARMFAGQVGGYRAIVPRVSETVRMVRTAVRPARGPSL